MTQLINTWSTDPSEEDSMTDEHVWIWQEMINIIPQPDLSSVRVLDVGCNQGGFLRKLYDQRPFASGVGIDIARDRVALANAAKGDRLLQYVASSQIEDAGDGFDLAFSHEVIYLIEDLQAHARQVGKVLKTGGHYDAVTCCHADSPLWAKWRPKIAQFSNVGVPNHSVADIASAFRSEGFEVSISRFLANSFIPTEPPTDYFPTDIERLDTYTKWKLCFRCVKQ
ncbi:MAG: class I SAM-dependent methyltransferase [Pseudomonadota bacterium]